MLSQCISCVNPRSDTNRCKLLSVNLEASLFQYLSLTLQSIKYYGKEKEGCKEEDSKKEEDYKATTIVLLLKTSASGGCF